MNTLFSSYTQGENRVTSTILAVLERLPFSLVAQILKGLLDDDSDQDFIIFQNQVRSSKQKISSIPDARIGASFDVWIETKVKGNSIDIEQLERHLAHINVNEDKDKDKRKYLLVLTPDKEIPQKAVSYINNHDCIRWSNFGILAELIHEIIDSTKNWSEEITMLPAEKDRTLLQELYYFLYQEKLIPEDNVLVIPARFAYDDYGKYKVYICQPNRTFSKPCSHIAFYRNKKIEQQLPRILDNIQEIVLDQLSSFVKSPESKDLSLSKYYNRLLVLRDMMKESNDKRVEEPHQYFILEEDEPLDNEIAHKPRADGKTVAFVRNQRYIPLSKFRTKPRTTEDLL